MLITAIGINKFGNGNELYLVNLKFYVLLKKAKKNFLKH